MEVVPSQRKLYAARAEVNDGVHTRTRRSLFLVPGLLLAGCGAQPAGGGGNSSEPDILASVINVTPFELSVVLSGVRDGAVDTVERDVAPSDSADVAFLCVDELVVGDPLEPAEPGILIDTAEAEEQVGAFTILRGPSYECGDIVEIIVSGTDAETFAVDVFALTPP